MAMSTTTSTTVPTPRLSARGVIDWLVAKDRAHRNTQAIRDLPPHLLQDVGLTDTPQGLHR